MDESTNKARVRFFADAMLGSLARWMRTLGYDVEYSSSIEDNELAARAEKEGRIILTRDRLLIQRRKARDRSLLVTGNDVGAQLRQVVAVYRPPSDGILTRCLRCNAPLEQVSKEAVKDRVPEYVYATQESFSACLSCKRVYWSGTHRANMLKELERLIEG